MNLWRKSSRQWRGVDFMTLVPRKACGWTDGDRPGQVVVLQPRFGAGILGRFLQPRLNDQKKFLRIPLEERGSYLWGLIDGQRTVGDMAVSFRQNFPEEGDQVPERVSMYLYQMLENNLIEFVEPKA